MSCRAPLTRSYHSLSTIHREYAALQSVIYLDLFDDIISPRPAPVIPTDSRAIAKTVAAYQVNQPQAEAIHGALKTSGFSLIQGSVAHRARDDDFR